MNSGRNFAAEMALVLADPEGWKITYEYVYGTACIDFESEDDARAELESKMFYKTLWHNGKIIESQHPDLVHANCPRSIKFE